MTSFKADDDCYHILLNAWYLDDGVHAGDRSAVVQYLIEELGPHLGLRINSPKCKLFRRNAVFPNYGEAFPSTQPGHFRDFNLDILGISIWTF